MNLPSQKKQRASTTPQANPAPDSDAVSRALGRVSFHLSPYYRQMGTEELATLSPIQRQFLDSVCEQSFIEGGVMAYIERIRLAVMQDEAITKTELAAELAYSDPTGVDQLFNTGGITSARLFRLERLPVLKHVGVTPEEIELHACREAVTWIRRHVWRAEFKGFIRWDEFLFISMAHELPGGDIHEVHRSLPPALLEFYSTRKNKWTPGRLLDSMDVWGKAYRTFVLNRGEFHVTA